MNGNSAKTVLITGANSGIGFEAAAQFCQEGFGKVILACRSIEKSEAAKASLIERTGTDVFEGMTVDVAELASVSSAVEELAARQSSVDVLLLNAAAAGSSKVVRNSDGIDITFAST
ncbi:MAG: SDR family NAD(P)-dependent oxidoreductase, partial [Chloroflexi bacterium]|nr:SDR family NAD(P)-dependent oxidoreductase [Chloroflexota bacterium]